MPSKLIIRADRATISHSKHPVAQLLLKNTCERVAQFGGRKFKSIGGMLVFCYRFLLFPKGLWGSQFAKAFAQWFLLLDLALTASRNDFVHGQLAFGVQIRAVVTNCASRNSAQLPRN